ncbi:YheT family hydrolase [Variovorax sp. HJSM1_2]|uniref:YheT family hydrolase n=1 Tax=Variovorax sp. HJSM1_2 TaxID=3366263 RepID=UPI003BCD4DA1
MNYVAPWWLPGGHLQTIWPALYSRRVFGPAPRFKRERWIAPDMDFVDVDFCDPAAEVADPAAQLNSRPLLVLFHGLEGSSGSHYAQAFADYTRSHGMAFAVPHFRGCSGELNLAPRVYHSGDFEEIDWILARMRARHRGPVLAVGVSLGGNALLRWAEEKGAQASRMVRAVAAVSSPVDLVAAGRVIGRGFNRQVYTRMFLRTMKPKAMAKYAQFPGLFDRETVLAARDLYEFDNAFTAPVHGFKSVEDYWARASAKPRLADIRVPTLVVNASNDPFVPAWSLPHQDEVGEHVTLWQPSHGGHVGFPKGRLPGHVRDLPDQVGAWLVQASQ